MQLASEEKSYHNMFECVIRFLIIFCQNNETNKKEILGRFDDLLNLINFNVKAEKLLGLTVQSVCQREIEFKPYLQAIFQKLMSPNITRVGQTHIFEMLLAFLKKEETPKKGCIQDSIQFQKKIQKQNSLIPDNQSKILNHILQLNLIQPFLEQHKSSGDFQKYFKDNQKVKQEIYMYKSIMKLISTLSENNQLSIIQFQRIMVYDDMKQLLLSPQSPYIIKKEIFKIIVSTQCYLAFVGLINNRIIKTLINKRYIQLTEDQNSSFTVIEMNDLLQNVILKDLSQFSRYIEGLVDPDNKTLFEDNREKGVKLQQRIRDFIKELLEEKSQVIDQKQVLIRKSSNKEDTAVDIIASQKEYWDYLYSGSNWNFTKDGLLQIILDIYQEIDKRNWITEEEDSLSDNLLLIQKMCENIRGILKKIQNKFQIDLSRLTYMFSECIIQNVVKKQNIKHSKHQSQNLPGIGLEKKLKDSKLEDLETYVKGFGEAKLAYINEQIELNKNLKDRMQQLKDIPRDIAVPGSQTVSSNQTQNRQTKPEEYKYAIITYFLFFEKLRNLILQKFITIHQIYEIFDSKYNPLDQNDEEDQRMTDLQENESQPPFLIKKQVFIKKFVNLFKEIGIFGINDPNYIDYDDLNFFFNSFVLTYPLEKNANGGQTGTANQKEGAALNTQNLQGKKGQESIQFILKKNFLKKFTRYVEKNKSIYKKGQKNELIQLTQNEKSYQQLESLKKQNCIFKKISENLGKEKPFKQFALNILNELLQCSDQDQRRKIKIYFEQFVNILKKKDPHYFNILKYLIEELGFIQNKSINVLQNNSKQTNSYSLFDSFGLNTKQARESKKILHPQKYLKISQNLIWNLKLYYQILVTISDIYSEQQQAQNSNKNTIQFSQQTSNTQNNQQQQQDGMNNSENQISSSLYYQVNTLLKKKDENFSILLNCMKIINGLYQLNLKNSHASILSILKKPSNIKITRNFLSFIKQSFSNYLQAIENLSNQDVEQQILYKDKKEELQMQEEIVLQVLTVVQNSCELCNEEFQNFFRTQNITTSQSYVPLNILSEILYFLTNFTKLKCSYFSTFDQAVIGGQSTINQGQNLRYYLVINQCISTLKNLCNGTSPKNKDLLLNNSHFLVQLNAIITESELDLQSENLKDVRILQTVSNCIDLLLTIIVCSNNQTSLLRLISIMNMEKLIKLLNFIYHYKIKSRLEIIQQEQVCTHQNSHTCSTSVCFMKCITYHDQLIMRLAFNIVIVIQLILDTVNEEDLNMKMRIQEENTLLLGIFLEMKKKEDLSDIDQSKDNKSVTTDKQSKIYDQKKSLLFKNSKTVKKNITSKKTIMIHNNMYNEIKEDQSSRQEEEDNFYEDQFAQYIGMQKEIHPTSKINYFKKERLYLRESLSFYLQFVGSVEIVQEKQISKLFFRIPLLSSYLTHNIRKNLIHKAVYFSDKNRLKLLMRYSEYFQHEMRFCQNLSKNQIVIYAVEYRSSLNTFIFILIMIINLIFLFKMEIKPDGSSYLPDSEDIVFQIIKLIHIILTFASMIIVTIERYPVVTYQNFIELKQTYRNKLLSTVLKHKLVAFAFDFDFIYYLVYLILAFAALNNLIIYSVLLIDIIKQSEDLKQIIKVTRLNFKKLIKTTILCFLLIFIYSLIGATVFPSHFSKSESFGTVSSTSSTLDYYFFYSTSLLEGILNPQGINEALIIPGVSKKYQNNENQSDKYWDRQFYDVSFWIIINFIFLKMMLGQIIDSYAEFRNLQKKYEKNIKRKCFICGLTVEDLEAKTLDWEQHVKYEHNLNNYLNYIIYIKSKPIDECDGIEKYVKECISKEITDFFPQRTSLSQERNELKKL